MRRNNSDDGMALLGVKSTPHKEIFVKHLDYSRVKLYCRRRGVFILQARVFKQSDCNRANIRVSLKIEDVEVPLASTFGRSTLWRESGPRILSRRSLV